MAAEGRPVSRETVWRVHTEDLGMHGYHARRVHELRSPDQSRRVQAATKLLEIANFDPTFLERIVWTDEANFELSGAVNLLSIGVGVISVKQ